MKYLASLLLVFLSAFVFAQSPVKWSYEAKCISNGEYELTFSADIKEGWTIYSQFLEGDGPIPTAFEFEKENHYTLLGKCEESGDKKTAYDNIFEMNLTKFKHNAVFRQKIKASDFSKPIKGYLTFMTCDATQCMPPKDIDFVFRLPSCGGGNIGQVVPIQPNENQTVTTNTTTGNNPQLPNNQTTTKKIAPVEPEVPSNEKPVTWAFEAKKINETTYDLVFKSAIQDGWWIYSPYIGDGGPNPTTFEFEQNDNIEKVGKISESANKVESFEKVFSMKLGKFKHDATFIQRVTVKDPSKPIKGYLSYQACDATKCLPPTNVDFSFSLNGDVTNTATTGNQCPPDDPNCQGVFDSKREINAESFVNAACGTSQTASKEDSLWTLFLLAFAGGLVALLTPCVFPMIPLTVSFFTKGSENRSKGIINAIIYGLSIIIIYLTIGLAITGIFGENALNMLATNPWMNLAFFLIFIAFALSFFGYYEITLPSSWSTSTDKAADKGGLIGIFFMAFTLALVSFSCTGPIIGSLLVQSVQSGASKLFGVLPIRPLVGMFGFSFALALPFALFAMFPSWLNSLPKSGGWMNNVKVTLGFLEIAFAFKFLSTADLVAHWNFLRWEVFLAAWILVFLGLGLYQFGKIKFPHDSPLKKITTGRWIIGTSSFLIVAYLFTGFAYKPLALLSGLAPSYTYNYFGPKGCVHGIECFHDFDEAKAYAQKVGKPLFVDFTGYGCVNCRKMEENVWDKPEILKYLKEDYVVVSLYVDDEARLFPDSKQKYLLDKHTGEKIRTVGAKWASFQINNFEVASQPYYILMDNDGKTLLTKPTSYTPNISEYKAFLECGVQAFKGLTK